MAALAEPSSPTKWLGGSEHSSMAADYPVNLGANAPVFCWHPSANRTLGPPARVGIMLVNCQSACTLRAAQAATRSDKIKSVGGCNEPPLAAIAAGNIDCSMPHAGSRALGTLALIE